MKKSKVLAIQALVFVCLLVGVEGIARVIETRVGKKPDITLNLILAPYMMFNMPAGDGPKEGRIWQNIFTNEQIPAKLTFNNFGYAEKFDYTMFPDFAYLQSHAKKQEEKLVLMTGASVVHGVGATSIEHTIPKQMEKFLNQRSSGTHYRVLNMAMGSWTAYQQFIGLSMFGRPLNPDWVIVMDGHNDAILACGYGTGAGNPMGWPKVLYLAYGGKLGESIVSSISEKSALVRLISGPQNYVHPPGQLAYHKEYADQPYSITMKNLQMRVEDDQLRFYLQAQRNVIEMFSRSNVILSLQPVMYDNAITPLYRVATSPQGTEQNDKALDTRMQDFMGQNEDTTCAPDRSPQLLAYFLSRAHIELKKLVASAQKESPGRKISYANMEWAMPIPEDVRKPYFIDNAHMSDKGQERIGEIYAEMILAAEHNKKFDYAAFVKQHAE